MNAILGSFSMFAGETPVLTFGPTVNLAGAAVDITGATISFVLRQGSSGGTVEFEKTVGSGVTIPDQTVSKGVFTIALLATDTASLKPGGYYFEARVTLGGVILSVAYGTAAVLKTGIV